MEPRSHHPGAGAGRQDEYEGQNLAHNSRYARQRLRCHERLGRWLADTSDDFVLPEL
jgi:hypothetical protein